MAKNRIVSDTSINILILYQKLPWNEDYWAWLESAKYDANYLLNTQIFRYWDKLLKVEEKMVFPLYLRI